ncbi:conserved Plasmodium protein, unknown function [Plasmodium berghei]|uniref:Condensin-2 complex subunit D3, putative n=2 Tax=Plasmodium berghei TaxID=5821 RepID=A0A509ALG6_PLABA|nr:condensin-2 complex subunit D3, putative [Plasmodium berghei ANKA]CXI41526.1 conserved Plasmodium protein, unknown function [Plasmodium berghei]SCM21933.1 conserved Plasmodium protein, unknown function [Plasmodium berghei]SCN25173.1 conserved Plasmodium protein, unknown function [Plasmodium berghei]SCO60176.1 conserved Plasmodium protein, unknown function [Plasmodium berghei]SCO61768.1 conserved Plasmodium protein, unknown function [Plasmodium berghei]|eukprot:XP_034421481.1 condensin-2 complex subunit D3, putative [Plasmodium berghei ANKA]
MEKCNKRKLKEGVSNKNGNEHAGEKKQKTKIENKAINEKKLYNNLQIHNNVLIKFIKENEEKYGKLEKDENIYRKLKAKFLSLNISNVSIEHYDSFDYFEKNKIDFLFPELDNIVNSSNIDVLKGLSDVSFYPNYNETIRKRIVEWLVKERAKDTNTKDDAEHTSISYLSSMNILLTYLIYKNDNYSNYACLICLNMLKWMHIERKKQMFRLFTLKGILKRFLLCTHYLNDKEIMKIKKLENDQSISEEDTGILKNIFMLLYESIEYLDISNLVNINSKNCIFELIKFYIELLKYPLIHSVHILCINYLMKIVRKCYDIRFEYNINVELYDIGPHVNIFVKIVNLIFAKILSILKDIKNSENVYYIEEINNINNLIALLFTNILNSCIRIIIPQVLYNDKQKQKYLLNNEMTRTTKINKIKDNELDAEDKIVLNACNPVFSFIEIFIINNSDKYEKTVFTDLIKIIINSCRRIEKKYNVMKIIHDEFMLHIKGEDNKKNGDKYLDQNYLKTKKISKKRLESKASFKISDDCNSSVYSETECEEEEEDYEETGENGKSEMADSQTNDYESEKETNKYCHVNRIKNKTKSILEIDNKMYYIVYESVMIRYLNILLKYMNCEKHQIRNMILDLFLILLKKKKTNKNENIYEKLFRLFLERLEDSSIVVKSKALSILVTLTNKKHHNNNLVRNFIYNKRKEKINMYKIISSNIFSHRSNIRKLTIQYIEVIFETLISQKLNYKIFLIFISNYLYSLSFDSILSVRRQVLLTVNILFLMASNDEYIGKLWIAIILSAITDTEETIKDEAISIFINTFIKASINCSIFNTNEKKINQVLEENGMTYFKALTTFSHELKTKKEDYKNTKSGVEANPIVKNGSIIDSVTSDTNQRKYSSNIIKNKEGLEKEREECDKNNDGVILLIEIWEKYFESNMDNYFLTLLKMMTKYDLLNFNLILLCLKQKKNNVLEEFIKGINIFIYNLRYFSIRTWNTFIFDFVIELSKEYQNSINFESILFLLSRCYKIYLINENENINKSNIIDKNIMGEKKIEKIKENPEINNTIKTEFLFDSILTDQELANEKKSCPNGILKNIMLKLFTIIYNLLDNENNEVNENFLEIIENTIFNFNCPICFIYIILNILIKKKKNVNQFIDKLKNKIHFFFEKIEIIPYNNVFCNILVTFIFLINHYKKQDTEFLTMASEKLKIVYENVCNDKSTSNSETSIGGEDSDNLSRLGENIIMVKNCIYMAQCVLIIDKDVMNKNDFFLTLERDLKNSNTCMNILNNLIILTYYMIKNFGSSCNKFVFNLLRFFKHENSFIRYLSFYMLSKLISEDYVKFNNQFFFGFLYLLADKNEIIRKQSLSVFKHIVLIYNKSNLINYMIDFIFVLNNFYSIKLSKHLIHIGNHFEIKNSEDRYKIYCLLIENLTNSEKFSFQQKLINEYLIQYVYDYDNYYFSDEHAKEKKGDHGINTRIKHNNIIPINDEGNEGSVLKDVLLILSSRLMKIKIKKDFAKLEEKNKNIKIKNVESSVKVLNDLMKNILKKNTLPILLSLRAIMLKTKSFFFKYINNLIIYLCIDYKDSLEELIFEAHTRNEIFSDIQHFVYTDIIHSVHNNNDIFNKNSNINIDINFLELSQNQMIEHNLEKNMHNKNIRKKGNIHKKKIYDNSDDTSDNSDRSSDYEEVSNVLHSIHNRHQLAKNKKINKKTKKNNKK